MLKKYHSLIFILVVAFVATGLFYGGQLKNKVFAEENQQATKKEPVGIFPGYYAPDFTLKSLLGEDISLSDFQGKYLLLNFWAVWCPPCKEEMPDFEAFYQENKELITILGVEQDTARDKVQEFITTNDYNYPIVLDPKRKIGKQYRVSGVPTTFIISPEGQILHMVQGPLNMEMLNQIKDILLNQIPEQTESDTE